MTLCQVFFFFLFNERSAGSPVTQFCSPPGLQQRGEPGRPHPRDRCGEYPPIGVSDSGAVLVLSAAQRPAASSLKGAVLRLQGSCSCGCVFNLPRLPRGHVPAVALLPRPLSPCLAEPLVS